MPNHSSFHQEEPAGSAGATAPVRLVSALCLKVPSSGGEELVVHREGSEDYVFLFEALDDAVEYARAAEDALGHPLDIRRVRVSELHFRTARYKPALSEHIDLPLRRR